MKKTLEALLGLLLVLFLTMFLPSIIYGKPLTSPQGETRAYSPIAPYTEEEAKIMRTESHRIGTKYGEKILKLLLKRFQRVIPKTKADVIEHVGWAIDYYSPNIHAELTLLISKTVKDPVRKRECLEHFQAEWSPAMTKLHQHWTHQWCNYFRIDPTTEPHVYKRRFSLLKKGLGGGLGGGPGR